MKFIHAADIHLDSPLTGLSAYADAPTELLRTATRDAFSNLMSAAIDEQVDFMIIAGDLYDGNWKDYNTGVFFSREMGRLNAAGVPVFIVYGNHDADSEMTKRLTLPPNVVAFGSNRPHTHRIQALRVALHGQSFKHAATTDNLAIAYPAPIAGWLNIGVLHTALEGYAAHASYAPCALAELAAKGYDYWALGHVHEYAVLDTDPWVVFPGNLQGRHIRECGARGAVMATIEDGRISTVERLITDVLRWQRLAVDVSAAEDLAAAVQCVAGALRHMLEQQATDRPVALRVVLNGRSGAHGDLFGNEARLRAEVVSLAAAFAGEQLWIEKVRIETTAPLDAAEVRARGDAIADLQTLLDHAPNDPEFIASLTEDLRQLADRAPHKLADLLPELNAIRRGEVGDLVAAVVPGLVAHLIKAD